LTKRFPDLIADTIEEASKWIREVTRSRDEDIGNYDKLVKDIESLAGQSNAAEDVTYDNATSGLTADNVQDALDEIEGTTDSQGIAITAIQAITSVISGKYCIGQIVTAVKSDTASVTGTTMTNVSGLSVTITPGSTSSVILVFARGIGGCSAGTVQQWLELANGTTPLEAPTSPSNRKPSMAAISSITANDVMGWSMMALNSPASVAAQTYNVRNSVDAGTGYINRSGTDTDSAGFSRGTSSIFAIELRPIP
jgi:hypothetical protein